MPAFPSPTPLALAIVSLSALSTGAAAQTAEPASQVQELAPVVVKGAREPDTYTVRETAAATKLDLSPRETPQSLTVITRERLQDQNLTSLRQVLDNTPGVYSNTYDTERVVFYSRGFKVDTQLVDGTPRAASFTTSSIDDTPDSALFERIEIVRGASGLMTGAGSPGAAVNLVRKRADSKVATGSVDLTVGSWRAGRVELDGTLPLTADGSVRARGVVALDGRHSYQDLYQKRTKVFYGVVDADLTPRTRLSVGVDSQDNQPTSNTWGSFPMFLADGARTDWPTSVTTATDWAYWSRKTQTLFADLSHTFDNGWALKGSLSRRRFTEDDALFYMYGFPDPADGTGLLPYAYRSSSSVDENALDVYASGPFKAFGRTHELVVGYNASRSKKREYEYALLSATDPDGGFLTGYPVGNFFQWDGSYPKPQFADEGTEISRIRTVQNDVYAAARLSLADTLKFIGGARYATWRIDAVNADLADKYKLKKIIPYGGLVWDVLPQASLFASYTGIYKPQSERDVNGRYLVPAKGSSVELGIKGEHFDRRLNTALTLFRTRQANLAAAARDPDTGAVLTYDGFHDASKPVDTVTRGVEIEVAGRVAEDVKASVGWTRNISKDEDGLASRTFIPSTMLRAFTTWEPRRWAPGLTLGAGLNWQSSSKTTVTNPLFEPEVLRQGSVTLVSLMARYAFTPKVSLQFNASNVFDRKYYVLDEYDNTAYGAPANYALTLRLAY